MKYEIIIKLNANRRPTLAELNDFLFCRIRDNDLKYTVNTMGEPMELKRDNGKK
mgnify:CR=1 FL=1